MPYRQPFCFNGGRCRNRPRLGRPVLTPIKRLALLFFVPVLGLTVSPNGNRFPLKGAVLLTAWHAPIPRPTMDIDRLLERKNSIHRTARCGPHSHADRIGFGDGVASQAGKTRVSDDPRLPRNRSLRLQGNGDRREAIGLLQVRMLNGRIRTTL